jgi:transcriptional regulator with XRE-family HTH domain
MFINVWSKYEAIIRILGITKDELACLCGSDAKLRHGALTESKASKRVIKVLDNLVGQFDEDVQKTIYKLRDALMTTNYKSITARKRSTSIGNFMQSMGFTQTQFATIMKVNEGAISKVVNNRNDKDDDLEKSIEHYLTARYSVLSAADQDKVDTLRTALDISGAVKSNPFRKELIAKGILGSILPHKPEAVSKEVEDLKEYIKLLEEENETLREKNIASEGMVAKLRKENEAMEEEIMDLNRELEVRNTSNAGLQDGVTDLNQKVDELEAEIFRLEEEKDYLLKLKAPSTLEAAGEPIPNMVFYGNCTVNIYNGSRENSGT